ncbi:MAG: RNA polymerase sigma factor [Gaiellales bacterium]
MRRRHHERDAGRELAGLYREHSASVYAYAYHLLGSREDAEDVVQIAFLQAHRALLRGEELVNPRAWLSVVVKRQAFNRWRDRRELPVEQLPEPAHQDRAQEAAAELAQVRAALFSLPEAQHQAFVLRYWSGLSGREIAEVLGATESAVESLLVRARSSILAAGPVADACVSVRDRLARQDELSAVEHRHVTGCTGCRRAQQRLARVAAAAMVLALVPRAHVAQALAATVPGFAGASAAAGAGGATGAGVATKALGAKLAAVAVLSAATVGVARHAVMPSAPPPPARQGAASSPAADAPVSSRNGTAAGDLVGSSIGDSQIRAGRDGTGGDGGSSGENGQDGHGTSGSSGDSSGQSDLASSGGGDQGSGSSGGGGPGPSTDLSGGDQSGGDQASSSSAPLPQGDPSSATSGGN